MDRQSAPGSADFVAGYACVPNIQVNFSMTFSVFSTAEDLVAVQAHECTILNFLNHSIHSRIEV